MKSRMLPLDQPSHSNGKEKEKERDEREKNREREKRKKKRETPGGLNSLVEVEGDSGEGHQDDAPLN